MTNDLSAEINGEEDERLTFEEAISLTTLPVKDAGDDSKDNKIIGRYISRRRPHVPGEEFMAKAKQMGIEYKAPPLNAYGGVVYAQAGLAASRGMRALLKNTAQQNGRERKMGIHTIHGLFTEGGLPDRPFYYEVMNIAENLAFPNILVKARQPLHPSTNPAGDDFPPEDADLPLGPVCFSALVSFRPDGTSQVNIQELSVQSRFASILSSRDPTAWNPVPTADIAGIINAIPNARQMMGNFPGLEMRKVDMREYNAPRPIYERRELLLYRLLSPLPDSDGTDMSILAHAFVADRNGLLLIGDHLGFGDDLGRAASLSYSFVVHVNFAEAVMTYGDDQWWVLEASFPRVEAGRGIYYVKVWSPQGIHVASEYQDGIIRHFPRKGSEKGKL
ncbi:Thioesterase/thiol ester dehydrase-isomerase [Xylariaceae sp. FL0255]|nr:Thioesterase/thiol ester dehydrase-isomerase [Xylariaceae sp. FL0255]